MTHRAPLLVAVLVLCGLAGTSRAQGLSEERDIVNGLISLAAANEIRETCPDIEPRLIAAWRFLRSLRAEAREAGYSAAEIKAYVENDAERTRLEGVAKDYLRDEGVVRGDPESYCAVGRDHIARETRIGLLLRTR